MKGLGRNQNNTPTIIAQYAAGDGTLEEKEIDLGGMSESLVRKVTITDVFAVGTKVEIYFGERWIPAIVNKQKTDSAYYVDILPSPFAQEELIAGTTRPIDIARMRHIGSKG